MNSLTFVGKVKKHFGFLEAEYSFKVLHESNSIVRPETDGAVRYESETTGIFIDSETGYVTLRFYRAKDGDDYYLTPVDIHEYFNTSDEEKEVLLSTDPEKMSVATALFNEKFLLNQSGWKGSRGTVADVERELRNLSHWVRDHTNLTLKGNFQLWPRLYAYKIHRARADHLRRGEDELVFARVRDIDGKYKLIKKSVFQDDLDYIEKLQSEFLS